MEHSGQKLLLSAGYIAVVVLVSFLFGITTMFGWMIFAAFVIGPPVMLMLLWKDPSRSMSESIQAARR